MHGLSDRLLAVFAGTATTRHSLYDLDLFAVSFAFDQMADEHDAIVAGVGALQALEGGVVRLYGVVMVCCVEGIAGWRYALGVHSASPFLWAGARERGSARRAQWFRG